MGFLYAFGAELVAVLIALFSSTREKKIYINIVMYCVFGIAGLVCGIIGIIGFIKWVRGG